MTKKSAIDIIKKDFIDLKAKGTKSVDVEALIKYVENFKSYDEQKHQADLVHFEAQTKHSIEMFRSVIDAGKDALRAIMIINGGAVIALMALLGNIEKNTKFETLLPNLNKAMAIFAIGVLLTAVSYGSRYLSQFFFANDNLKVGHGFNILSVTLALTTYVTFGWAVYITYCAFAQP